MIIMDAIVIGRVREFLDVYRSGNLEEALKKLRELEDFVERLLSITRDAKALALALNVYMAIPLYEDMIKIKMKIEKD
ncbi:hypothetical protein [Archaeoglobus sp.]